jgi:hypothetical protein
MVKWMGPMKIHKQKGMTLIGFIFVLAFVIFLSFIGMKIGPMYMEYYSVVSAMNGIASERGSARLSPYQIKLRFLTRLNVSYTENVRESHIKLIRGNGVHMRVTYEVRKPIVGNLDVVGRFDNSVQLAN